MAGELWLSDRQWAAIEPLLPRNRAGVRRVDDRRFISGSSRSESRMPLAGLPIHLTTVYNRFHRLGRPPAFGSVCLQLLSR